MVIATVGFGNIGDQAMFEAYLQSVPSPVIAIFASQNGLTIPQWRTQQVEVITLPSLVGGLPTLRIWTFFRYCFLLRRAASVSVIGADIMDGGYDRRESIFRSRALITANRHHVPGRVLGFSWNGVADRLTIESLKKASATSSLYARDPMSFDRLQSDGMKNLVAASDTAFVLLDDECDEELSDWLNEKPETPMVIINASGLIMRSLDLTDDYAAIIGSFLARGFRVILLPHVLREGDDDRLACRAVADVVASDEVYLVDKTLSPRNVSWLAAKAEMVISGRMHLAIIAMNRGTPCITLSTQGKVEGFLQMFALSILCIEPVIGLSIPIIQLIEVDFPASAWKSTIVEALPRVRSLARQNYLGLK